MNKVLAVLLSYLFCASNVYSQERIKIDNPLNRQLVEKSVGLWQGVRGSDTFTVLLKATPNNDSLFGWHEYKKGGVVESSRMNYMGNNDSASILHIAVSEIEIKNQYLVFGFVDYDRSENIFLAKFKVTDPGKASWNIFGFDMSEGMYNTYMGDRPLVIPPPSEIMKIKEWHMIKLQ